MYFTLIVFFLLGESIVDSWWVVRSSGKVAEESELIFSYFRFGRVYFR